MTIPHPSVLERDYYAVSDAGISELRSAGTTLSAEDLELLVLIDGRITVARIAERLGVSSETACTRFSELLRRKLIIPANTRNIEGVDDYFRMPLARAGKPDSTVQASSLAGKQWAQLESTGYYVAITRRRGCAQQSPGKEQHTVLVVDDDPSVVSLLRLHFEHNGLLVRTASNRDEIVAALRRFPVPDLALLDIMMPDADGFDVLARVRMHPILKEMPIVMMSSLATRDAVLKGLQLGADGYLTKPFTTEAVLDVVRAVLGAEG